MMSDANVSVAGSQQNLVPVTSRKSILKKRTRLERCLLTAVAILVILLFIFFVLIIILACRSKPQVDNVTRQPTCNSEKCIASAFSLLESMDRSADPCENFYQFACGKWGRAHPVKDTDNYNNWFSERTQYLLRQLKDLLTENSTNLEPRAVQQAKSLFTACQDTGALEELGLKPIMQILQNVSLPKQIPNSKTVHGWDIAKTLARIQRIMSQDLLVQLGPDLESTDDGKIVLNLSPPNELPVLIRGLVTEPDNLPKVRRLNSRQIINARMAYMIGIMEEMDAWGNAEDDEIRLNKSSIASAAIKILLFEAEVNQGITSNRKNSTSSSTVRITIQELQRLMGLSSQGAKNTHKIDWMQYFTVLMDGIHVQKPFNIMTDTVSVTDLGYFLNLASVLANARLETIQRYVWWQVVDVLAPHTNRVMRDLQSHLQEKILGTFQTTSRSTLCLRRVKKLLPIAVSYTLAAKDDVSNTVSKVSEMLNDIKKSFNSLVHDGDWIDPETKNAALEKAESITNFIGYQEWLLKTGQLDEYYSSLDLQDSQYLWNILRIKSKEVQVFLQLLLDQPGNQKNESWNDIDPLQVNAYYSRTANAIIIPAGILQFPFYDRGLEALNYGSIGSILGHELTHGFDIEGKNYGKDGTKVSWWNMDMLQAYEERAQCFVHQYNQYTIHGYQVISTKCFIVFHQAIIRSDYKNMYHAYQIAFSVLEYGDSHLLQVDGQHTLAENIADNGGIREAYRAYQRYKERHNPEEALPGMEDFSHDQLLFLAFANIWCTDEGPDYAETSLEDSHSPGKYRVLGPLSNSPEFSKIWNCPPNSTMNPSNRCIIW